MTTTTSRRRADLPTFLLHWGMVAALLLSVSTGWRIASMTDASPLLRWVDVLLLQGNVVRWHFVSATLLTAFVAGYLAFLWQMGLGGRLALRLAALRSRDRATRRQAINKLVYWVAFVLLGGAAVTGGALYFAPTSWPSQTLSDVHRWLSWAFVAYIGVHVLLQLWMGGLAQLLKIVTPRLAYGIGAVTALTAGVAGAAVTYFADSGNLPALHVVRSATLPVLDGDPGDAAWAAAPEAVVRTTRGFGLQGGDVDVHVRALHDGRHAYLLFRWADATRSQKHVPLQKTADGWKVLQTNYFNNDENEFYEDKFAVMLARSPVAGGNTVQLGSRPIADKPGPASGLGLHASTDGSLADVWHWKSVRSGPLNQFDDNYFGPPMDAKPGRYTGGYGQDAKTAGGFDQNFTRIGTTGAAVKPKFLPRDLAAQQAAMGRFDPDPNVGDAGRFWMTRAEVQPYTAEADAKVPVGTVIPSVVVDAPFEGDRGDVTVHAIWKDGFWTLEARRLLDTGSAQDQAIADGVYLWVAVFDHNQVRHTRHVRPLRLSLR